MATLRQRRGWEEGDVGATRDRPRREAALPTAHTDSAAAARAAATARGAAAAAASSTPALPTSRRPRRLSARPARALAPAPKTGAHQQPPGTRWGRPGARTPRPGHVSAGRPAHSPAPPGRPPTPGRRSEQGRRVSTDRRARCLLPSPGEPSPNRGCRTTAAHAGCPNPMRKQKMERKGASPPCCLPGAPSFGKERQTGRRRGPATFHSLLCFALAGGATEDCRAERQSGEAPSTSVFCAYVSARPDSREDRS